jgi:hypothetical protein
MSAKSTKSFNGTVFEIAYKRLKLKRREKIIFQRLLGFLIRNDLPFSYGRKAMSELTGYSCSSIDEALNRLETLRLIKRVGFTNRAKFVPGTILNKIFTLAQNRIKNYLVNKCTLPQKLGKYGSTTPETGNKKTSSSLKRKEHGSNEPSLEDRQNYVWYMHHPQFQLPDELMHVKKWLEG